MRKYILLIAAAASLASCKPKPDWCKQPVNMYDNECEGFF